MDQGIVLIRPAHLEDAETVIDFNRAMARETEGRELDHSTLSAGVRQALRDSRMARYFIAEIGGRIAGQLMLTEEWSDWRCGRIWWIQSVYVAEPFRGKGVYRALHNHVECLAGEAGDVCALRLYVERSNRAARNVYERLGMQETSYLVYEQDLRMPENA